MKRAFILIVLVFMQGSCNKPEHGSEPASPPAGAHPEKPGAMSEQVYYDKVLGLLIGSAIGDAMGAPTEMWSRKDIQTNYGFVHSLDSMVRFPSAEGTWKYNLPAGGTTDDTRWKKLFVRYALSEKWPGLEPTHLAEHIVKQYEADIVQLKSTEGFRPEPYEENLMKMAWLQEWAMVADAYGKNDMVAYANAVSKFYGGEMTCAGMLYSPLIGACAPADPHSAYSTAYNLSIFDIGYARDITALVAAMVSQAFDSTANPASLPNVIRTIDPQAYFKSRLVGRSAFRFYQAANNIVSETKNLTRDDVPKDFRIPKEWNALDTLYAYQLSRAYTLLDTYNEDLPFQAGEIYLITITSMIFSDYDFEKTMAFIINYGRDNDTVAAVAGAILGTYLGAAQLPEEKVKQILQVNKSLLDNDLEDMARTMTDKYMNQRK